MSAKKQELYKEIETLPEEYIEQVINFVEYLKLSHITTNGPESLKIKDKKDLKNKLQKGMDDMEEGRVYSVKEVFDNL